MSENNTETDLQKDLKPISFETVISNDQPLNVSPALMDLQSQFPFLPISPPVGSVNSTQLEANIAEEIHIPQGARMMRITWTANDAVFMSRSQFKLTDIEVTTTDYSKQDGNGVLVVRTVEWRACFGMRSLWIMAPNIGAVSIEFFVQL